MASSLGLLPRSWLNVVRPFTDANVVRSFSLSTTLLADKKQTKAKATPKPASAPPKGATTSTTKGDAYEVPEYYAYDEMSYYAMESDMRKSRLPQPKPGQPCD